MADLTKCSCKTCPIKSSCLRYTAAESMMQSYFVEDPCEWLDEGHYFYCEYFIENNREKRIEKIIQEDFKRFDNVFKNLAQ